MPDFAAFVSFSVLAIYTPGPNNIMAMTNAARYGFRKAVPFNAGVFAGISAVLGAASAFSAALYAYMPGIEPYMKAAGCVYIFYLAWKTLTSAPRAAEGEARQGALAGFALQFVNPKGVLFAVAVMSTFITPYYRAAPELAAFSVLLGLMAFSSTCGWSLFGAAFQKALARHQRAVNVVMSALLAYCGVSLFL